MCGAKGAASSQDPTRAAAPTGGGALRRGLSASDRPTEYATVVNSKLQCAEFGALHHDSNRIVTGRAAATLSRTALPTTNAWRRANEGAAQVQLEVTSIRQVTNDGGLQKWTGH